MTKTSTVRRNLLSSAEAAEFLGLKKSTLDTWRCVKRYGLPYVRCGRSVRYRLTDLERWLASRTVGGIEAGR